MITHWTKINTDLMKFPPLPEKCLKWLVSLAMLVVAAACAASPEIVDHAFAFDTGKDGQNAVVLNYRYGGPQLAIRAPEWAVKQGRSFTFESVQRPMPKGDYLYVKWRDNATGRVYEDTVDLRHRLPEDIADHTLYFMIRGAQLYVYLISPASVERPPEMRTVGPRMYRDRKIVRIYPG